MAGFGVGGLPLISDFEIGLVAREPAPVFRAGWSRRVRIESDGAGVADAMGPVAVRPELDKT